MILLHKFALFILEIIKFMTSLLNLNAGIPKIRTKSRGFMLLSWQNKFRLEHSMHQFGMSKSAFFGTKCFSIPDSHCDYVS